MRVMNGRYDLIGRWPAAMTETRETLLRDGGVVTLTKRDALHLISGARMPIVTSLFISTEVFTAGVMELRPGTKTESEQHPGDEVLYVTEGRLNVYLPDSYDWFEAHARDSLFVPEGTRHEYWNYDDRPVAFAFCVAPRYR